MPRLRGLQVARMRRVVDRHLPSEGEVWRRSYAPDGKGGMTETLAQVSSGPWRISPLSTVTAAEQVYAARLGGARGWWATSQHHVDVRLDDQIRVDGRVLEVASTDTGRSEHFALRVLCREVS